MIPARLRKAAEGEGGLVPWDQATITLLLLLFVAKPNPDTVAEKQ